MIVATRYRDIPFEEAIKCVAPGRRHGSSAEWEAIRGTPIAIETPPIRNDLGHFGCDGPFFYIVPYRAGANGGKVAVCPHLAEIGD